jgi:hypothetical protein
MIGDKFTIAGVYAMIPNSDRKRWQFWKPKLVQDLQIFTVGKGAFA